MLSQLDLRTALIGLRTPSEDSRKSLSAIGFSIDGRAGLIRCAGIGGCHALLVRDGSATTIATSTFTSASPDEPTFQCQLEDNDLIVAVTFLQTEIAQGSQGELQDSRLQHLLSPPPASAGDACLLVASVVTAEYPSTQIAAMAVRVLKYEDR
jgi:hypothetical protein